MSKDIGKIKDRVLELKNFLLKHTLNEEDVIFIEKELTLLESSFGEKTETDGEEIKETN